MKAAVALLAIGLLLPGFALPEARPEPDPGRASMISWTGTLVPAAIGTVAFASDSPEIGWMLLATGVLFGPSAGYFYGHRPGRAMAGVGVRAGFATVGVMGVAAAFDESSDGGGGAAIALLAGGIGVLTSLLWDLLAVGRDVGTTGEERAARSQAPFPGFVPPEQPRSVWIGTTIAARVFDQLIPQDTLGGPEVKTDVRAQRLAGLIWASLVQRYMAEEGIEAGPTEIEAFRRAPGTAAWIPAGTAEDSLVAARAAVMQWKLNRSLYRRYGGEVGRTPLDPIQPVGAYRDFLQALEARRVFEFYDAELRREFWRLFSKSPKDGVPSGKVRFDAPWWLPEESGAAPVPHRP